MMEKKEIEIWLATLPDNANVAIDEGGLALVEVGDDGIETDAYLEVGLTPREEDLAD